MSSRSRRGGRGALKNEALLLLVTVIWGSAFPAQQIAMRRGLPPMTFTALRFALGVLVLAPIIHRRIATGVDPGSWRALPVRGCLVAGLFLFGAAGFQQVGLIYTSSANSAFITAFYILFVPLIGLMLGHRPARSLWAGIAVCLVGFYLLSVDESLRVGLGDGLTLVCALLWACQILTIDRIAGRGDPIRIAAVEFMVCALLSALAALLFERATVAQIRAAAWPVVYVGVMSVGIAFTLQVVCQKRCPPGPAAVIMSLEAVFGALAGYIVLNQILTMRALTGCALILVGVLVVELAPIIAARTRPTVTRPSAGNAVGGS